MAVRLRVALVLLGCAGHSLGSGLAASDSDACGAGDHSLLQVDSRGSVRPKANGWARWPSPRSRAYGAQEGSHAGFVEAEPERAHAGLVQARGESLELEPKEEEKRTLKNITMTLEGTLDNFSAHIVTLVTGNHKLCTAEGRDDSQVETMMNVMKTEELLQVGSGRRLAGPEERPGDNDGLSAVEAEGLVEVQQKNEGFAQAVAADPDAPAETLSKITADVGEEEKQVQVAMEGLQKEENKLTVLGMELSNRIQVLASLLQTETEKCPQDLAYAPPPRPAPLLGMAGGMGVAEVMSTIHRHRRAFPTSRHKSNEQSVLEAEQASAESRAGAGHEALSARANARRGREKMETLLKSAQATESDDNITFANLTTKLQEEMKGLEDNVGALVAEKNKLSVADTDGASHLDGLQSDLNKEMLHMFLAQFDELSDAVPQAALASHPKVQDQLEKNTKIEGNSTAESALADKVTQTAEALADEASKTAEQNRKEKEMEKQKIKKVAEEKENKQVKEQELEKKKKKKEMEKQKIKKVAEGKEKEQVHEQEKENKNKNETEKQYTALAASRVASQADQATAAPEETTKTTTPQPSLDAIPLDGVTAGVDTEVKKLDEDVAALSVEKHQACWASKKVLDRLQVLEGVLGTLACRAAGLTG